MSTIETVTGRLVDLLNPSPESIHFDDIAWSLSRLPRYVAHTINEIAYSVAQHSIFVCSLIDQLVLPSNPDFIIIKLRALLHDATEAYTGDMPGPLKHVPELHAIYAPIEDRIESAIFDGLNISAAKRVGKDVVKAADRRAQQIEMFNFMRSRGANIKWREELSLIELQRFEMPRPAVDVYHDFKDQFNRLMRMMENEGQNWRSTQVQGTDSCLVQ